MTAAQNCLCCRPALAAVEQGCPGRWKPRQPALLGLAAFPHPTQRACASVPAPMPCPSALPPTSPRSVCAATHAILSLAVSAYALLRRDLSECEGRAFCFDDMTARMLTVRLEGWSLVTEPNLPARASSLAHWATHHAHARCALLGRLLRRSSHAAGTVCRLLAEMLAFAASDDAIYTHCAILLEFAPISPGCGCSHPWQMHAGYALFEVMFWQRSAAIAVPWNEMVFLGSVVSLLMAAAALVRGQRVVTHGDAPRGDVWWCLQTAWHRVCPARILPSRQLLL